MARHRNVRNLDFEEELCDDVYGQSYEEYDGVGVSPRTEAEFMYHRGMDHTIAAFIGDDAQITEEDDSTFPEVDSSYSRPTLDPLSEARLQSCIEQLQDVLGEACHEESAVQAVLRNDFDVERALNELLNNGNSASKQPSKQESNVTNPILNNKYYKPTSTTKSSEPNPFKTKTLKTQTSVSSYDSKTSSPASLTDSKNSSLNDSLRLNDSVRSSSRPSSGTCTPTQASRSQSMEDLVDGDLGAKTSKSVFKKEVIDVEAELCKRQDGKDLLNLVVIGHVDAGKSTLMGHLLVNLGNVSQKAMHKNETDSRKTGKGSFAYAWVLDETEEERARGITMDVAMTIFETESKIVTLMDAPGHRDFIPNMIQGTAQADVGILVVDSRVGEFEAGFEAGGQTREHALLARSLGVAQLIVAVNKMDATQWAKERYDNIVIKLKTFLTKQAGFKEVDVAYVPCSGLSGENLSNESNEPALKSWYHGNTLVQHINAFRPAERPTDKPFRLCVSDVYKGQGSGFIVAGKVESGHIQNGERVILLPANDSGHIKGLTCRDEPVKFGAAGDHVTAIIHGVDLAHVNTGSVICEVERPMKMSMRLAGRIIVFNIDVPITKGFMIVFHAQTMSEPAVISRLVSILHKATGDVIQSRPRCLTKNMSAMVELKFSRPIPVELYKDNKVLGRFMLRYAGKTISAGFITEIK